jgi:hypothetical protein
MYKEVENSYHVLKINVVGSRSGSVQGTGVMVVNILVTLPRVDLLLGCRKEFIESDSTACQENSVSMLPDV